jgi:ABC-type branched-subunit amino acid transport system substrate-binding protein
VRLRRFIRVTSVLALTALVVGAISGCGGKSSSTLKIGDIVPLTGDLAPFGPSGEKAARLAVDQANKALKQDGIKLTVKLENADEQTNAAASVSAARKLISEGATCIAGAWASSDTIPVSQSVTSREHIPQISPASTSALISTLKNGYIFRTSPSDKLQGKTLADYVDKTLGGVKGKLISIAGRNDAYGQGFVARLKEVLSELGAKVQGPQLYDPAAASYDSEAAKIVANNPTAFIIIDFPKTYAKVGPALLRTGKFDPTKLFISDGLAVSKIAGSGMVPASLNGAHGTNPSSPPGGTLALSAAAERAFNTLYTSSPGPARETFDVQNFDAVTLCVLAAVAAKSNSGSAIAKQIIPVSGPPGTKYTWQQEAAMFAAARAGQKVNYEGVSGPIDMASNGDPTGATYAIYTYENGALKVLRKVFATGG